MEASRYGGSENLCLTCYERKAHHPDKVKSNLAFRLSRIEVQIREVKGLIKNNTYCYQVLNQIAATQTALNGVRKVLLTGHIKGCVVERIKSDDDDVIDDLLQTIHKLMK